MHTSGGPALALAVLLCLVPIAAATGAFAASGSAPADPATGDRLTATLADDEAENETPRHENPDEYGEDGDLDGMESWLSERLSSQLGDSAIQLSQEEYDLAREHLGDDYNDRLGQYVDVAGETEGDSQEDTFEETREEQEQLTDDVEEYRETRDEYEEARDEGDEERARELARELEELSERINDSSATVRANYEELEAETGIDFSEPDGAIEETNAEVQTDQETVRSEQFVETALVLEPESDRISFSDPLVATGEVETADGSTLANEELQFEVENETVWAETDADGTVTLEYRPIDLPLNTTQLSVRYVPDSQSTYLGSETTVPVSVEQVEPEIEDLEATDEVAYGDEVRVTGTVAADGVAVDGVPIEIAIDGERLGTVTASNGAFDESLTMPAGVPAGEHELTAELAYEERALASTSETVPVTVRETESALTVDASYEGDGTIAVEGALETTAGDGVGNEPVQLRLDGTTVGTVTTGPDGTFEGTAAVPDGAEGELTVTAVYEGAGSNVAPADAETMATVPAESGLRSTSPLPAWLLGVGGVVIVGALVAGIWSVRRRRSRLRGDSERAPAASEPGDAAGAERTADATGADVVRALLERAGEQIAAGHPDAAVRSGYGAVRRALESRTGPAGALTHWEFYRDRRSESLESEDSASLRAVTEGYERAAFGRDPVTDEEATAVLERARRLCGLDRENDRVDVTDD